MRPALGALVLAAALALAAAATAAADELSPEALLARYQPVTVLDQASSSRRPPWTTSSPTRASYGRPTTMATRPSRCPPPACPSTATAGGSTTAAP